MLSRDQSTAAVVIIGAGMSGICTAIDLIERNNTRNFIILEKASGLGGTWYFARHHVIETVVTNRV